jgi:hypothetical protein
MKKLTDDLKRMLDGLAIQDAGDYLLVDEKSRQTGLPGQAGAPETVNAAVPPQARCRGH